MKPKKEGKKERAQNALTSSAGARTGEVQQIPPARSCRRAVAWQTNRHRQEKKIEEKRLILMCVEWLSAAPVSPQYSLFSGAGTGFLCCLPCCPPPAGITTTRMRMTGMKCVTCNKSAEEGDE